MVRREFAEKREEEHLALLAALPAGHYLEHMPWFEALYRERIELDANGNAIVLMKAIANPDGSLSLQSIGKKFGDPGFYFTVHAGDGAIWARYVASMKEEIRVYAAEPGITRADHTLWLWGREFLRLHYRMSKR